VLPLQIRGAAKPWTMAAQTAVRPDDVLSPYITPYFQTDAAAPKSIETVPKMCIIGPVDPRR
jgi:hypothetical protein